MTTSQSPAPPTSDVNPWSPPPIGPLGRLRPQDVWPLAKQIDELGGEWSYQIFSYRALNFHLSTWSPRFYEPIYNFDRLGLEALLRQRAEPLLDRPNDDPGSISLTFEVFPSFFDVEGGRVELPATDELAIGRHTVTVLGIEDADTVVFQHGWPDWAPNGIGFMKRDYIDAHATEMWMMRACDRGPLAHTAQSLLEPAAAEEFRSQWRQDREHHTFAGPSNELTFETYSCWSLQDECLAEVLVLKVLGSVRAATAIILHRETEKVSALSDLFVWPAWRRRGFGTLLENFAATRAEAAGSETLEICVWDADAVNGLTRAKNFLSARGHDIESFADRQLAAVGQRAIKQH